MSKTIVIFGATGKVGCYTALHLKEKDYHVIACGRRASDNGFFADYDIPYYSVDFMNQDDFKKLPQKDVYGVIHLAAVLPATMKGYYPRVYVESNIFGTMNVLDYAVAAGVKRFVYPKSVADVDYLHGSTKPIPADAVPRFPINTDHTIYAITKNASVDIISHYSAKHGFRYYIIRLHNVFGFHPNPTFYKNGIKRWTGMRSIIEKAKRGEDIELWGNPDCARDFCYIKDLTQIIEKMMSSNGESGVYNVGVGKTISRKDQIQALIDIWSPKEHPSKIIVNRKKPDSPFFLMDISKTKEQLGYEPKYFYKEGMIDIKDEMERNRFKKLWGTEKDYTEDMKSE